MNIASTTVIKTVFHTTANARYKIEYNEVDGFLSRIHAEIHRIDADPISDQNYIGSISLDQGYFVCQIPTEHRPSRYFEDIEEFIDETGKLDNPIMAQSSNFRK